MDESIKTHCRCNAYCHGDQFGYRNRNRVEKERRRPIGDEDICALPDRAHASAPHINVLFSRAWARPGQIATNCRARPPLSRSGTLEFARPFKRQCRTKRKPQTRSLQFESSPFQILSVALVRLAAKPAQRGRIMAATDQTFSQAIDIWGRTVGAANFALDHWWIWLLAAAAIWLALKIRSQHALIAQLDERAGAAFGDVDAAADRAPHLDRQSRGDRARLRGQGASGDPGRAQCPCRCAGSNQQGRRCDPERKLRSPTSCRISSR